MAGIVAAESASHYPRVAITFCTQCKWMLRAAYYAQELMSTFGTSIGEVALIPATGGIFTVVLTHRDLVNASNQLQSTVLWDFKSERSFPETKILKQRLRNYIDPEKKLGHSDTPSSKKATEAVTDTGAKTDSTRQSSISVVATSLTPTPDQRSETDVVTASTAISICEDCK